MKKVKSKNEIIVETWEKRTYDEEQKYIIRSLLLIIITIILGILTGYIIVSWT